MEWVFGLMGLLGGEGTKRFFEGWIGKGKDNGRALRDHFFG